MCCLKLKYSCIPKFHHILADGTGVFFFDVFFVCWYILFILSCGCVTIVNRKMKKCQCYLIYDKANGNVATNSQIRMGRRLFTMMMLTRKSVKLKLKWTSTEKIKTQVLAKKL